MFFSLGTTESTHTSTSIDWLNLQLWVSKTHFRVFYWLKVDIDCFFDGWIPGPSWYFRWIKPRLSSWCSLKLFRDCSSSLFIQHHLCEPTFIFVLTNQRTLTPQDVRQERMTTIPQAAEMFSVIMIFVLRTADNLFPFLCLMAWWVFRLASSTDGGGCMSHCPPRQHVSYQGHMIPYVNSG